MCVGSNNIFLGNDLSLNVILPKIHMCTNSYLIIYYFL